MLSLQVQLDKYCVAHENAYWDVGTDATSLFFRFECPPKEAEPGRTSEKQGASEPNEGTSGTTEPQRTESVPAQQDVADLAAAEEGADAPAPAPAQQDEPSDSTPAVTSQEEAQVLAHTDSSALAQQASVTVDASLVETTQPESDLATVAEDCTSAAPAEPRLVLCRSSDGHNVGSSATAYVVKNHDGRVGEEDVQAHVSVGVLTKGATLGQLTSLLEQVFMQSIVDTSKITADVSKTAGSQGQQSADDTELLAALHKFIGQLRTSEVHLTGSVQLAMPSVDSSSLTVKDDDLLIVLESTMHEWTIVLQDVKLAEAEKSAQGDGPLDEIHFWRERNNVLGGLHEQINLGESQAILE